VSSGAAKMSKTVICSPTFKRSSLDSVARIRGDSIYHQLRQEFGAKELVSARSQTVRGQHPHP